MTEDEGLDELQSRFVAAMADKEAGRIDAAEDAYRAILAEEPRLAEPRLELAHLLLATDRVEEAVEHARLAVEHLEAGGQWVEDLSEEVVRALAHRVLAEALRRRADEDDVIFGDPEVFRGLLAEARAHFERASRLDPSDAYSSYHAFFMGIPGARIDGLGEDDDPDAPPPPRVSDDDGEDDLSADDAADTDA